MAAKFAQDDDSVVVVVGSGAGGGTLATDLALKGVKVVCLEAGDRPEIEDFLNHVSLLIYLDRIDAAVRSLVIELPHGVAEGVVNLAHAVAEDIREAEQDG